jgi:hypothetical protein
MKEIKMSNESVLPEDGSTTKDGEKLTIEQRIQNCEMTIGLVVASVEKVFKSHMEEIQKTQQAVLSIMRAGTKNQQKLLVPPQYRKPYLREDDTPNIPGETPLHTEPA